MKRLRRADRTLERNDATAVGVNFDLGAARTRLLLDYVARSVGSLPRKEAWVSQLQVRF